MDDLIKQVLEERTKPVSEFQLAKLQEFARLIKDLDLTDAEKKGALSDFLNCSAVEMVKTISLFKL